MEKTRRPRDHLVNQDTKSVKKREENRGLTMWAMPTSQSLFFSTLLGRVQFRDIDLSFSKGSSLDFS